MKALILMLSIIFVAELHAEKTDCEMILETEISEFNVKDETLSGVLNSLVNASKKSNDKLTSQMFKGILFDDESVNTKNQYNLHLTDVKVAVIIDQLSYCFMVSVSLNNGILVVSGPRGLAGAEGLYLLPVNKYTCKHLKIDIGNERESLKKFLESLGIHAHVFEFRYEKSMPYIVCKGRNYDLQLLQSLSHLAHAGLIVSKSPSE
jgi:hypothetical protein